MNDMRKWINLLNEAFKSGNIRMPDLTKIHTQDLADMAVKFEDDQRKFNLIMDELYSRTDFSEEMMPDDEDDY